jgi:IS5 family transposase
MKLYKEPTLADSICDLRTRKIKTTFFAQINTLINWKEISKLIDKDYSRGKSATGKPSYDGVLLFRMCLLTYVPSVHAWKYMKYTPS